MTDTTRAERTRTFLKAVISFNNGAAKLDCVVKNISATGARLDITAAVSLPSEFTLQIPHRGETHRCHLVRRELDSIGVRFVSAAASPAVSVPARAPSSLEAENARLRLRVKELTLRLEALGQDPNGDNVY